ncbi:MAG: hypothetical protein WKG01_12440 [Kofleriaceae bacterium]
MRMPRIYSCTELVSAFCSMVGFVLSFSARRVFRPKPVLAGLAWMVACGVGAAVLALARDTHAVAPYLAGAGALGWFVSMIFAMVPQHVTLAVTTGEIVPSWRAPERGAPVLGSWVVAGVDAPIGLVLRVGALRVGGGGLDGAGYSVVGAATRTVDCQVGCDTFEAICAAVGIRKGDVGPLVVPLLRNSQSTSGLLRTMAPWLLTMAVVFVLAIVAGQSNLLTTLHGQLVIVIATVLCIVVGITVMVVRSLRIRAPELELRVTPDALVLARFGGDPISHTPWSAVGAVRRRFIQSSRAGRYTMPLLVLTIEGHEPLRLGAWDHRLAWTGEVEKTWRGPCWIVGSAVWPRLTEELAQHRRLNPRDCGAENKTTTVSSG